MHLCAERYYVKMLFGIKATLFTDQARSNNSVS